MKQIYIYDTTLRDGTQGVDVNYTVEDKVQIAHTLDDMRIDYIEGGFPFSNEKDAVFFKTCQSERFSHAKIVAFGSTRKAREKAQEDPHMKALLACETPVIAIVGKSSKAHVTQVLKTTPEENLEMIADSISFLKQQGREIVFDAEHFFDGYKEDAEYAVSILRTAAKAGADSVVVCDTNGGTLPHEVEKIFCALPLDELPLLGGHFHDDCGTAVANSLVVMQHGARQIQGTINGWGERCGNANLCTLIPNIILKTEFSTASDKNLKKLTPLARFVAEKANIVPNKRHPYVGDAAFSHKAGLHADVVLKAEQLMEHIDGAEVGNERHIVLSELAGKSTIVQKLNKYGSFMKHAPEVDQLIQELKRKEKDGYAYEAAEASFDLLIRRTLKRYRPMVNLRNYHLELFKNGGFPSKSVARIFVDVDDVQVMGAASGIGPVETLDKTLRDALSPHYRFIDKVHITDYKVRILNPEHTTEAKVRVFITSSDHLHFWNTVGVHQNIVEASWEALVDSFEYYYNNFVVQEDTQK